ncbi:MAG: DinB family protein [Oscillochloris sp.]|nr:DinB family protein [Oscillochloris sp.]
MLTNIPAFIDYFERVRRRTLLFFNRLPPEHIDWAPRTGEFTCGDLIRHVAAAEQMFAEVAAGGRWVYPGHNRERGQSLPQALDYLAVSHSSAIALISTLDQGELQFSRTAVGGKPIEVWRVLMLMVEHEIHHRSQFAEYLTQLGIAPPQIYGLKLEDLLAQIAG